MIRNYCPAVCIHTVLQINNDNFSFVFMFLDCSLSKILEMWTTNISEALIIAVVSAILHTLPYILFSSMVCLKSAEKQLKQQISRHIVISLLNNRAVFFCVTDFTLFCYVFPFSLNYPLPLVKQCLR